MTTYLKLIYRKLLPLIPGSWYKLLRRYFWKYFYSILWTGQIRAMDWFFKPNNRPKKEGLGPVSSISDLFKYPGISGECLPII